MKNWSRLIVGVISLMLLLTVVRFAAAKSNLVCVVVQAELYDQIKIKPSIDRYLQDMGNEGFNTELRLFRGGTAEEVRAILKSIPSLEGAVLIGDIPAAIYEIWRDNRSTYFDFPSDLFLQDLDGNFTDTDGNGKYDLHSGSRSPEIWVGRIKCDNMSESEISLMKRYFDKNHNYRTGALRLPERALIYLDDDWSIFNDSITEDVALAIQDTMVVYENETTNADNYLSWLSQNWSLVQLAVHGTPTTHNFQTNGQNAGVVDYRNVSTANYRCFFYNLFSCWNGDYRTKDYIGGWYIFSNNYGLAVVCSTRPGGMWFTADFYRQFQNNTLGFAFREWLANRIAFEDKYPDTWYTEDKWFSGMTILGDPTLGLQSTEVPPPGPLLGDINGDGIVDTKDLVNIALVFGLRKGNESFDPHCDLNNDQLIDIIDLVLAAQNFGKRYSP